MTNQELAREFLDDLTVQESIGGPSDVTHLAEAFAAVRLDERRAIVAFLRDVATTMGEFGRPTTVALALLTMAEQIERGEHGS